MKFLSGLLFLVVAVPALADSPPECRCFEPRKIGKSGSRVDWKPYNEGVVWHRSLECAKAIARKDRKLIFYYKVAGDLDKEGC